eukprot:GHVH01007690.1.p2 GENE.GHVH01007690.1~~GHVH01007690.1.p2  ORF type:complete len:295 (-),score=27.56 GHVH01007690.1:1502-2386(-)
MIRQRTTDTEQTWEYHMAVSPFSPPSPEVPSPEVPSPEVPSPEVPSPEVPSPEVPSLSSVGVAAYFKNYDILEDLNFSSKEYCLLALLAVAVLVIIFHRILKKIIPSNRSQIFLRQYAVENPTKSVITAHFKDIEEKSKQNILESNVEFDTVTIPIILEYVRSKGWEDIIDFDILCEGNSNLHQAITKHLLKLGKDPLDPRYSNEKFLNSMIMSYGTVDLYVLKKLHRARNLRLEMACAGVEKKFKFITKDEFMKVRAARVFSDGDIAWLENREDNYFQFLLKDEDPRDDYNRR